MSAAPEDTLDFRNVNALWGSVLVETLVQLGLRQAVISPGSRSAPLTVAFARHAGVESLPVLDERSAAFFALGLAKQRLRPVALVCTSGSAAANYLPAIVEAHETGVPLVVLTADRPPELRDCHSGQTIDQQKLYGSYVNFYHELAVPEAALPLLRYLRQTVVQAYQRALRPFTGPVHLNCPFRDPLPPVTQELPAGLAPVAFRSFFASVADAGADVARVGRPARGPAWPSRTRTQRGLVVVGPNQPADDAAFAQAVGRISRALGWPVLADALAPVRQFAGRAGHVVCRYEVILRNPSLAEALRPEQVICLGGWPTSKALRGWLQTADPLTVLVSERAANEDALHLRTTFVRTTVSAFSQSFTGRRRLGPYTRQWRQLEARAGRALAQRWRGTAGLVEPKWVEVLARHLRPGVACFLASSMPVRDAEYFWPPTESGHRILFNRGANGIDGTLSTALGVAHGGRPTVLVAGDLAFLHDGNGLLIGPKFRGSLTVILINNDGGGIFGHLPIAQFDPPFEEFFATPQQVDFAKLCAAHGVEHVRVRDWPQLGRLVAKTPGPGIRVLELRTDRKKDAAWRKELFAAVAAGLERDASG